MTPVIAHKLGGAGTRRAAQHGVKADLCINMEHSNNTIANVCVGVVMVRSFARRPSSSSATARRRAPPISIRSSSRWRSCGASAPASRPIATRRLDDVQAASRAPGLSDPHLRRHAQGALLLQEHDRALDPGMRVDPAVPHRAGPDGRHRSRRTWSGCWRASSRSIPPSIARWRSPRRGTEQTWNQLAMVCPADHPLVERAGRGPGAGVGAAGLSSARTAASAMSATATSSRRCSASRPCSTVRATSASTRNGRHPTSACASATW